MSLGPAAVGAQGRRSHGMPGPDGALWAFIEAMDPGYRADHDGEGPWDIWGVDRLGRAGGGCPVSSGRASSPPSLAQAPWSPWSPAAMPYSSKRLNSPDPRAREFTAAMSGPVGY